MVSISELVFQPAFDSCIGTSIVHELDTHDLKFIRSVFGRGSLSDRIEIVYIRCIVTFATLLFAAIDLAIWTVRTVSLYYAFKRGWRHILDLINTIFVAMLCIIKIPFGYLPKVSFKKSFYFLDSKDFAQGLLPNNSKTIALKIENALMSGCDPNYVDEHGITPLAYCLINRTNKEFDHNLAERIIRAGGYFGESDVEEFANLMALIDQPEKDFQAIYKIFAKNLIKWPQDKNPYVASLTLLFGFVSKVSIEQFNWDAYSSDITFVACRTFLASKERLKQAHNETVDIQLKALNFAQFPKPLVGIIASCL